MLVSKVSKVYDAYKPKINSKKTVEKAEVKKDSVKLSEQAMDFQAVKKALSQVPDVREDKIRAISEKLNNGTYNVSASDIVSKMFAGIEA